MLRSIVALFVLALLAVPAVAAEKKIKSGPQVGDLVLPFEPLHCSGKMKGERGCLVCAAGEKPVVMIFARSTSKPLTQLIRKVDAATKKYGDKMDSFVVFLDDEDETLQKKLTQLASKEKLSKTVLAVDNIAGPRGYKIPAKADVTVILYVKVTVKANHVFAKGKLDEKGIKDVVKGIPTLVSPEK